MNRQQSSNVFYVALSGLLVMLCIGAVVFCLWSLLFLGRIDTALVGAVLLLGLAQLVAYFSRITNQTKGRSGLRDLMAANTAITREFMGLRKRVDQLEQSRGAEFGPALTKLTQQMKSMEFTMSALARKVSLRQPGASHDGAMEEAPIQAIEQQLAASASSSAPAPAHHDQASVLSMAPRPAFAPDPQGQQEHGAPPHQADDHGHHQARTYASDQAYAHAPVQPHSHAQIPVDENRIDLMLEPIIRLETGQTEHYRASLALLRDDGSRIGLETFRGDAQSEGWSNDLDLLAFSRAAPLVRRMRDRGRHASIFCPVTPQSLADGRFLQDLHTLFMDNQDIAGSLVIEVTQPSLAQLTPQGTRGLGYLARLGATYALTEATIELPDLAMLSGLGISYIDMDTGLLMRATVGAQDALSGIVDALRRHGMVLIAANATNRSQVDTLGSWAELARGSCFAPPRPVRPDLTVETATARVA